MVRGRGGNFSNAAVNRATTMHHQQPQQRAVVSRNPLLGIVENLSDDDRDLLIEIAGTVATEVASLPEDEQLDRIEELAREREQQLWPIMERAPIGEFDEDADYVADLVKLDGLLMVGLLLLLVLWYRDAAQADLLAPTKDVLLLLPGLGLGKLGNDGGQPR